MEHAGDRPDLAAQTDLIADIEPGELALRAGADHDLALAGAEALALDDLHVRAHRPGLRADAAQLRSEEHTSALQSLMRISYAVFCLHKNIIHTISSYNSLTPTAAHIFTSTLLSRHST